MTSKFFALFRDMNTSFKLIKVKFSLKNFETKNKIQQHHQQVFASAVIGKERFHFERILTRLPLLPALPPTFSNFVLVLLNLLHSYGGKLKRQNMSFYSNKIK